MKQLRATCARKSVYVFFFVITLVAFIMTSKAGSHENNIIYLPAPATHFKIHHTGDFNDIADGKYIRLTE